MTRQFLLPVVLVLCFLLFDANATAQSAVALNLRQDKLQQLAEKLQQRNLLQKTQVAEVAARLGIPERRTLPNGKTLQLMRMVPGFGPQFYTTFNVDAADSVSTDEIWPGGSAGLFLDGAGMRVGLWDAGRVFDSHPDLYGRTTQKDAPPLISGHSTHVAGTLIGSGGTVDWPEARGMANTAQLDAYDWVDDTAEMINAAGSAGDKLLLSNHSYGIAAGWLYNGGTGADEWWWIGGSGTEDPYFGYYDSESRVWDQIAVNAPYYLMVKAAGNDRWDPGPGAGVEYTIVDQAGMSLGTSSTYRPPDCAPLGYDCLPSVSVAKNILTVGSVDDVPGGYLPLAGPAGVQVSSFSGFGPTDDGRIKPDLVGNGWLLTSTYNEAPYFAAALGTSMAAPNVTGSLLLLQQHYENLHGSDQYMRAATLKALAIHSADETGPAPGPDYEYGWGLLNTKTAARLISNDFDNSGKHRIIEGVLSNGTTESVVVDVTDAEAILRVTLVWHDPPGDPVLPMVLDATTSMLVNDLDLRVISGGSTFFPWVLDPADPGAAAFSDDNVRDNVEQVVVQTTGPGPYTVRVSHKGTLDGGTAQAYSIIVTIEPPAPTSSGLLIDEDFSSGLPAGWSVVTYNGAGKSWEFFDSGSGRYTNTTGGSGPYAMVNNYDGSYYTSHTALQTGGIDLSSSTAAVLTFNSYFHYDFYETIYVETSTNGGTSWNTAWSHQGLSNTPVLHTLDLSASIAGHASALLRFRFQSSGMLGPDGDRWQIDNIRLESFGGSIQEPEPPGQAGSPGPDNGTTGVSVDSALSWSSGAFATSHNIYLGTDNGLSGPDDNHGNQTGNSYNPGTLSYSTQYFWRIDEVNDDGTRGGSLWSFTTEAAAQPEPEPLLIHTGNLQGDRVDQPRSRWRAVVDIKVHDALDAAVAGALVEGNWSNGATGSASCTTDGTGWCRVEKNNLKSGVTGVSFSVSALSDAAGSSYQAPANHDVDGNSNGTTITVPTQSEPLNTPPTVTITSPASSSYATGTTLDFSGSASDAEDNNSELTAALNWSSSLDGNIGSGGSFTGFLSDGTHTITATATDTDGASGSDSISLTIGSSPPDSGSAHVGDLTGSAQTGSRNRWTASVEVTVHDSDHQPISGAEVAGNWGDGAKGGSSCVTNGGGSCTVEKGNLRSSSASFTVSAITVSGASYDGGSNHLSSIVITSP